MQSVPVPLQRWYFPRRVWPPQRPPAADFTAGNDGSSCPAYCSIGKRNTPRKLMPSVRVGAMRPMSSGGTALERRAFQRSRTACIFCETQDYARSIPCRFGALGAGSTASRPHRWRRRAPDLYPRAQYARRCPGELRTSPGACAGRVRTDHATHSSLRAPDGPQSTARVI